MNVAKPTPSPTIYRLAVEQFRGIEKLTWLPSRGLNVILGGGDVGKTTILDAIALILSPTNPRVLADTDYYGRKEEDGFSIEAVLSLPPACGIDHQHKPSWVWEWKGDKTCVPSTEDDKRQEGEPVYIVRVRGTEDLELVYELIQPDGSANPFPVALRRAIGLVRLGGDDRNDRDLRLVQGSALDRLLSDKNLRSRIANEMAQSDVKAQLTEDKKDVLTALDAAFKERSLPILPSPAGRGFPSRRSSGSPRSGRESSCPLQAGERGRADLQLSPLPNRIRANRRLPSLMRLNVDWSRIASAASSKSFSPARRRCS